MTEKLIPVQIPLRPEKAHLYRTRDGGHIETMKEKSDCISYVWEILMCNCLYTVNYHGKKYTVDESLLDITHEVVEENEEMTPTNHAKFDGNINPGLPNRLFKLEKPISHKYKLTAEQQIRIAALNAAIKARTDLPYRMALVYETAQEYEKYIKTGEII